MNINLVTNFLFIILIVVYIISEVFNYITVIQKITIIELIKKII